MIIYKEKQKKNRQLSGPRIFCVFWFCARRTCKNMSQENKTDLFSNGYLPLGLRGCLRPKGRFLELIFQNLIQIILWFFSEIDFILTLWRSSQQDLKIVSESKTLRVQSYLNLLFLKINYHIFFLVKTLGCTPRSLRPSICWFE